jgi:uncharacterized protein
MMEIENTVVWADIPVKDLDRAMKFYGNVLQHEFQKVEGMDGIALPAPPPGFDPSQMQGPAPVSIDLAVSAENSPSTDGCTIYLNSGGDPEGMLQRAAEAGGEILRPVEFMGDMVGYVGFFKDTEGNRIGVHKPTEMAA